MSTFLKQVRYCSTVVGQRQLKFTHLFNPKLTPPKQAWVEEFSQKQKVGIVDLHPCVFGVYPRPEWVSEVIHWQKEYRRINFISMPSRNELPGGTRRPWPQKGTGRARHKSVNSPLWMKGGWARGPRGPETRFRMLPDHVLTNAMASMLTIKLAQDDLVIVRSIKDFDSQDEKRLEELVENRNWGPSVLIVDKCDIFPENISVASENIRHINLMPTFGLNVLSMAKHETLILTLDALEDIEEKLLFQFMRVNLNP